MFTGLCCPAWMPTAHRMCRVGRAMAAQMLRQVSDVVTLHTVQPCPCQTGYGTTTPQRDRLRLSPRARSPTCAPATTATWSASRARCAPWLLSTRGCGEWCMLVPIASGVPWAAASGCTASGVSITTTRCITCHERSCDREEWSRCCHTHVFCLDGHTHSARTFASAALAAAAVRCAPALWLDRQTITNAAEASISIKYQQLTPVQRPSEAQRLKQFASRARLSKDFC